MSVAAFTAIYGANLEFALSGANVFWVVDPASVIGTAILGPELRGVTRQNPMRYEACGIHGFAEPRCCASESQR